ncbi:hypothetical protein K490DRAFT_54142 [Saccharata proteae CBS 121410]|uniref:Uncharacterized protein n=1 Tax=Saccharata proteae CBS 121410 TaxID=1314787 RepID=A0A9P4I2D7_9PEZI|nr:hypothetical protein K490DRAFT_54142 [Saccharata proteae CBS 121410]
MDRTSTASPQSQLRLGLSRHGLPRGPTSDSSETSTPTTTTTLSIHPHRTNSTSSTLDTSKTTFYHVSEAPLSPPITPFSPSAFPSDYTGPAAADDPHDYHHNPRQTAHAESHSRPRRRSLQDNIPAPKVLRREPSRELSPPPDDDEQPQTQQQQQQQQQRQQPSGFARMAKKLKALGSSSSSSKKSGDKKAKEPAPFKSAAQRAHEFEEMEDVHWTEM